MKIRATGALVPLLLTIFLPGASWAEKVEYEGIDGSKQECTDCECGTDSEGNCQIKWNDCIEGWEQCTTPCNSCESVDGVVKFSPRCPAGTKLATYFHGVLPAGSIESPEHVRDLVDRICRARMRSVVRATWLDPKNGFSKDPATDRISYVCRACARVLDVSDDASGPGSAFAQLPFAGAGPAPPGRWTPWLDRDRPSGSGDYEGLEAHRANGSVPCDQPTKIECQTADGRPITSTGDKMTCSVEVGAVCVNAHQSSKRCDDYRVRFFCPQ